MVVAHDRVRWERWHSLARRVLPRSLTTRPAPPRLVGPARAARNTTGGKSALAPPADSQGSTREPSLHAILGCRRPAALPPPGRPVDGGGSMAFPALLEWGYRARRVPGHSTHRPFDRYALAPASSPAGAGWPGDPGWKLATAGSSVSAGTAHACAAQAFLLHTPPPVRWHLPPVSGLRPSRLPIRLCALVGG